MTSLVKLSNLNNGDMEAGSQTRPTPPPAVFRITSNTDANEFIGVDDQGKENSASSSGERKIKALTNSGSAWSMSRMDVSASVLSQLHDLQQANEEFQPADLETQVQNAEIISAVRSRTKNRGRTTSPIVVEEVTSDSDSDVSSLESGLFVVEILDVKQALSRVASDDDEQEESRRRATSTDYIYDDDRLNQLANESEDEQAGHMFHRPTDSSVSDTSGNVLPLSALGSVETDEEPEEPNLFEINLDFHGVTEVDDLRSPDEDAQQDQSKSVKELMADMKSWWGRSFQNKPGTRESTIDASDFEVGTDERGVRRLQENVVSIRTISWEQAQESLKYGEEQNRGDSKSAQQIMEDMSFWWGQSFQNLPGTSQRAIMVEDFDLRATTPSAVRSEERSDSSLVHRTSAKHPEWKRRLFCERNNGFCFGTVGNRCDAISLGAAIGSAILFVVSVLSLELS